MSLEFDLLKKRLGALCTLILAFCCAGYKIAAEEPLNFHFWAILIFLMVVS